MIEVAELSKSFGPIKAVQKLSLSNRGRSSDHKLLDFIFDIM